MIKKIKLRDLTPEQWDKNRYSLCKLLSHACCENCIFQWVGGCSDSIYRNSWINHKDFYSNKFLDQEVEIDVPDILNKDEKEYLSFIIKPFKDDVIKIMKGQSSIGYNITIKTNNLGYLKFPTFSKDKDMYKNMKIDYPYTVKELDL